MIFRYLLKNTFSLSNSFAYSTKDKSILKVSFPHQSTSYESPTNQSLILNGLLFFTWKSTYPPWSADPTLQSQHHFSAKQYQLQKDFLLGRLHVRFRSKTVASKLEGFQAPSCLEQRSQIPELVVWAVSHLVEYIET